MFPIEMKFEYIDRAHTL